MHAKTILLVEDELVLASVFKRLIEHANYVVLIAQNGVDALKLVKESMPDLVLCDINMPIMNGIEFCTAFRKLDHSRNVPFIFLTSNSTPEDVRFGMNLGADDYLKKPCSASDLLNCIQTRLNRKEEVEKEIKDLIASYTKEIEKRDDFLGTIAQDQSHLVRAPLAALMGVVDLIDKKQMSDENVRLVNLVWELAGEVDKVIREHVYKINHHQGF